MAIVITGVTGFRNRGVEALVRSAIYGVREFAPGHEVVVLSSDPLNDAVALGDEARVLPDAAAFFGAKGLARTMRQLRAKAGGRSQYADVVKVLSTAEAVIASGGDVFSSDYGSMGRHLRVIELAQSMGRPTVFLAHSIGPFKTPAEEARVRDVLLKASLVTVREARSFDYLTQKLGLPVEKVILTADVAFKLPVASRERVDGLKRSAGLTPGVPFVSLSVSQGITSFSSVSDREAHDKAWVELIRRILATTANEVLLVPHVQEIRPVNDDSRIISRVHEALDFDRRVRVAWGQLSATDYKGLIADSAWFAGERMHACIAALSTSVPTVAIGYSVKAVGIMQDLLGPTVEEEGLVVPVSKFTETRGGAIDIVAVEAGREAMIARMRPAAEAMKAKAQNNFDLLEAVLRNPASSR